MKLSFAHNSDSMALIVFFLIKFLQSQHERHENTQLRNENDKLRAENIRYKEALTTATCPNCGGPAAIGEMSFDEQHLRIENARLREEVILIIKSQFF